MREITKIKKLFRNLGVCDIPCARLPGMFPSIFKDANVEIDCGRGWRALLLNLLLILKKNNSPCKITRIREHYAILEIWFEGEDEFSEQIIHLATLASAHICSVCGKPGTMQGFDEWYSVVCGNAECHPPYPD